MSDDGVRCEARLMSVIPPPLDLSFPSLRPWILLVKRKTLLALFLTLILTLNATISKSVLPLSSVPEGSIPGGELSGSRCVGLVIKSLMEE